MYLFCVMIKNIFVRFYFGMNTYHVQVYGQEAFKFVCFVFYFLTFAVKLNGNRIVTGVLRGYDQFMNIVLDNTMEEVSASERNSLGMVVIRGNSIVMMEALERI